MLPSTQQVAGRSRPRTPRGLLPRPRARSHRARSLVLCARVFGGGCVRVPLAVRDAPCPPPARRRRGWRVHGCRRTSRPLRPRRIGPVFVARDSPGPPPPPPSQVLRLSASPLVRAPPGGGDFAARFARFSSGRPFRSAVAVRSCGARRGVDYCDPARREPFVDPPPLLLSLSDGRRGGWRGLPTVRETTRFTELK